MKLKTKHEPNLYWLNDDAISYLLSLCLLFASIGVMKLNLKALNLSCKVKRHVIMKTFNSFSLPTFEFILKLRGQHHKRDNQLYQNRYYIIHRIFYVHIKCEHTPIGTYNESHKHEN